jgi:hypothetical protein
MKKVILLVSAVFCFASFAQAQPKIVEKKIEKPQPAAIAPVSFKAKYEGGMFGFSKKEEGTLKFDDANFRLVFFDKNNKERFGIPYSTLIVLYPNTESVQSGTGKVVQHVPVMGAGIVGAFMKKNVRYMIINFDDTDMGVKGTTSFRLESAELLQSVIQTLGTKAEMQPRGDAYFRPAKKQTKDNQ